MLHDSSTGFIDLHSHLIPGVDDGCRRMDESLDCIRRLQAAGFVGSVCTPHVWPDYYPRNAWAPIRTWVRRLREELGREGIEYQLWEGGEVRIAPGTQAWLSEHGLPTVGLGRHVLVDYWGGDWPPFADELVDWLLEEGFQPVLAHPERMGLEDAHLADVVASLAFRGVLLQGNLRSLAGGEGESARRQLTSLLERQEVAALATDGHRSSDLDGRLAGIDVLVETFGRQVAENLLDTRPREILGIS